MEAKPRFGIQRIPLGDGREMVLNIQPTKCEERCPICQTPLIATGQVECQEGCYRRPFTRMNYVRGKGLVMTFDGKQHAEVHQDGMWVPYTHKEDTSHE